MNIYDFSVNGMDGKKVDLSAFSGKALLIVNTATRCGFTPQYTELEKLYESYRDRGFEILDFPSNQFREQAPEDIDEIDRICRVDYGTEFPRFDKIEVNGAEEDPLYTFLKQRRALPASILPMPSARRSLPSCRRLIPTMRRTVTSSGISPSFWSTGRETSSGASSRPTALTTSPRRSKRFSREAMISFSRYIQ